MHVTYLLPVICLFACILTLVFEGKNLDKLSLKSKTLASVSVVGYAWTLSAWDSLYGQLLLTGLVLSLIGDVLLGLKNHKQTLLLGIAAFLLTHICYALAFFQLGFATAKLPLLLPVIVLAMILTALWLRPHLRGKYQLAVPLYLIAIGIMLIFAWANQSTNAWWSIVIGASLFALSDLTVARNRFIKQHINNRIIGLPLYYSAQLMLAYSVTFL